MAWNIRVSTPSLTRDGREAVLHLCIQIIIGSREIENIVGMHEALSLIVCNDLATVKIKFQITDRNHMLAGNKEDQSTQ